MAKFKVGDKVEFILDDFPFINQGSIGELVYINVYDDFINYQVVFHGKEWTVMGEELELVEEKTAEDIFDITKTEAYKKAYDSFSGDVCLNRADPPKNAPKKYSGNKPMMSLVRPEFIKGIADVLTFGFKKYQEKVGEPSNYLKGDGMYYTDLYDSLQRHLTSWISGDSIDEESGKNHLLHAAANIMFLYTYEVTKKGKDNRETLYGKHNKS